MRDLTKFKNVLQIVIHALLLIHHVAIGIYLQTLDFTALKNPIFADIKRNAVRFFTFWNFAAQIIYLIIAIIRDVFIYTKDECAPSFKEKVKILKGFTFLIFIFPFALFVTALFWTLMCIDREMVLPAEVDTVMPFWMNHSLHTNILILLVTENAIEALNMPNIKIAVAVITIYFIAYYSVLIESYFELGLWMYGLFAKMSWTVIGFFILSNYVMVILFYLIGAFVHKFLWYRDTRKVDIGV